MKDKIIKKQIFGTSIVTLITCALLSQVVNAQTAMGVDHVMQFSQDGTYYLKVVVQGQMVTTQTLHATNVDNPGTPIDPIDPIDPPNNKFGLSKIVVDSAKIASADVTDQNEYTTALASFSMAYTEAVKQPELNTPQKLASFQKILNRTLLREYSRNTSDAIKIVLAKVSTRQEQLNEGGMLVTLPQHHQAWAEIASGFSDASKANNAANGNNAALDFAALLKLILLIIQLIMGGGFG